jgi:hypothetical protein
MDMGRRGFAPIAIALIVAACIIVIGGAFYYFHRMPPASAPVNNNPPVVATSTVPTSTPTSTPITSYRGYLTPSSGRVGTVVTIHASGFAPTGNQVTLDGMVAGSLDDLSSPDGKTLTLTVPSSLGPNCKPDQACPMYLRVVTAGSYSVAVISNGVTYNIGTFTVTGGGGLQATP